jgi:hypothetical protein
MIIGRMKGPGSIIVRENSRSLSSLKLTVKYQNYMPISVLQQRGISCYSDISELVSRLCREDWYYEIISGEDEREEFEIREMGGGQV